MHLRAGLVIFWVVHDCSRLHARGREMLLRKQFWYSSIVFKHNTYVRIKERIHATNSPLTFLNLKRLLEISSEDVKCRRHWRDGVCMHHEPLGYLFIWCVNKVTSVHVPGGSFPVFPTEKKKKQNEQCLDYRGPRNGRLLLFPDWGPHRKCFLKYLEAVGGTHHSHSVEMSTLHEATFHPSANLGLLGVAIRGCLLLRLIQLGWTLGSLDSSVSFLLLWLHFWFVDRFICRVPFFLFF